MTNKKKSDEEWKTQLNDESYYVTRQSGTERPFTGKYWNFDEKGSMFAFAVVHLCLNQKQNLMQVVAGQAFSFQKIKI